MSEMKTISIRLDDSIYEELDEMLDAMGQTKQTFYETFTRTALRERSIPFIIKAPLSKSRLNNNSKMESFARLEASRKAAVESMDYDAEREAAMNEKYGTVD
jgi:antitoxin component of RelBE/YafQ-DinJ toxin-antitoxin module